MSRFSQLRRTGLCKRPQYEWLEHLKEIDKVLEGEHRLGMCPEPMDSLKVRQIDTAGTAFLGLRLERDRFVQQDKHRYCISCAMGMGWGPSRSERASESVGKRN